MRIGGRNWHHCQGSVQETGLHSGEQYARCAYPLNRRLRKKLLNLVHTPLDKIGLNVYSYYDMLTINEMFCRLDYRSDDTNRVVVDFGSNIRISAACFLMRSADPHVYLFEPARGFNIERLRRNPKPFEGRYTLS